MAFSPEIYFRFCAEHIVVLREIFYRTEGIGEGELRQIITRSRRPDQASSGYIYRQLREMEIIEEMPGQTAFLELTAPWKDILGHLFREQRLTSIAVIQTYLNELQRVSVELSAQVSDANASQCVLLLEEAQTLVERLRRDSRDNRLGIITETLKFKSRVDDITAMARYERIIRLWEKYIEPLRDIIDSRKEMDERLRALEALANEGMVQFRTDSIMLREFGAMRSRLLRLLRDAMEDYRESVRELEPLYTEALQNSRYLKGATLALDQMMRTGRKGLRLTERLALPIWRIMNVLSDEELEAYLYRIREYRPTPPAPIRTAATTEPPSVIPYERIQQEMSRCMPIEDTLFWLHETYPKLTLHRTLSLYGRIFGDKALHHSFGNIKEYRFNQVIVRTHHLTLESRNE